jgi:4-hydroxythreonine-4-phosphate dehydrogenase
VVATSARPSIRRRTSVAVPTIVISSGEPAGIGPDICAAVATRHVRARLAVLGDPALLAARARQLDLAVSVRECAKAADIEPHRASVLQVLPIALKAPVTAGRLDVANSSYVLEQLRRGADLCMRGEAQGLVTAPVQKSVISAAGVRFSGHTEFLAGKSLRIALATTHLPLRAVADALTTDKLESLIRIVHADLQRRFAILDPRILVLGLNPHAGESGTIGREEQTIIEPTVKRLAARGLQIRGPVSADSAFTKESRPQFDVAVAMYHDQGLPVLKALAFGEVVNVTLGLPIIRTSVDHGTALALAGTGRARADSLYAALDLAITLAGRVKA